MCFFRNTFTSEHSGLFLDPLNNVCRYDNPNSAQSKTLNIILIFKWSGLDTHLWIFNLCSCHKFSNRTPAFGKGSCIQDIPWKAVQVDLHHQYTISEIWNFLNHSEKGGEMNQRHLRTSCLKQIAQLLRNLYHDRHQYFGHIQFWNAERKQACM